MEPQRRKKRRKRRRPKEPETPAPPREPFCNWPVVSVGVLICGVGGYLASQGSFNSMILGVGFAFVLCGLMMSGGD